MIKCCLITHLKEQGERNPLIVAVEGSVASVLIAQSWARNLRTDVFPVLPG